MSKYRISSVKPVSAMKRYEFLREVGVEVSPGVVLTKEALDTHVDEAIWRSKHPGQEPIKEFDL